MSRCKSCLQFDHVHTYHFAFELKHDVVNNFWPASPFKCSLACAHRNEVAQTALNDIRGMTNLSRVDEALYQDHESEAERKARLCCTVVLI